MSSKLANVAASLQQMNPDQVLKSMNPALRAVASEIQLSRTKLDAGTIIALHKQGEIIGRVLDAEEGKSTTYGEHAVLKLSRFMEMSAAQLYKLRQLARAFTAATIRSHYEADINSAMTAKHWYLIAQFSDPRERERLLDRVRKHRLSANALETEIRSKGNDGRAPSRQGGRAPEIPRTPHAAWQKSSYLLNAFLNYHQHAGDFLGAGFDEVPVDKLDATAATKLLDDAQDKARKCREALDAYEKEILTARQRIRQRISRTKTDDEVFRELSEESDIAEGKAVASASKKPAASSNSKAKKPISHGGQAKKKKVVAA